MKKPMTTMTDANGNAVPVKYVSAYDRARDRVARRILARFERARRSLETVVAESLADLDGLMALREKLGEKGNFQLTSFDGLIQVAIDQQYNIVLDERVAQARQLMLDYVNGVLDQVRGADTTVLRKLIEAAFRANRQGVLPTAKIFELMRMEVKDERWNAARGILQDAIRPQKGRRYLTCKTRPSTQADFRPVSLNLNDCWPREDASE